MNHRREEILALVDAFQQAHDCWVCDLDRSNPDEQYWTAVEALIHGFAESNIPPSCQSLALAVDRFTAEVHIYDQRPEPSQTYPHEAFWLSRDALQHAREQLRIRPLPTLEPIDQLREQQVPDIQICHIYGFFDRNGCPMPWLVQHEVDRPGSVLATPNSIDGRTWEDPREIQRRALEAADAEPLDQPVDLEGNSTDLSQARTLHRKRMFPEQPAVAEERSPESVEQLWQQRVPVAQAAKMLRLSENEVAEQYEFLAAEQRSAS